MSEAVDWSIDKKFQMEVKLLVIALLRVCCLLKKKNQPQTRAAILESRNVIIKWVKGRH